MTDSTHNTLVTIMIIVAVLIALVLISRGLSPLASQYRYYQGASAIQLQDERNYDNYQPRYSNVVTSYSRPSTSVNTGSTSYNNTRYETVYTYTTCENDYCWTY